MSLDGAWSGWSAWTLVSSRDFTIVDHPDPGAPRVGWCSGNSYHDLCYGDKGLHIGGTNLGNFAYWDDQDSAVQPFTKVGKNNA